MKMDLFTLLPWLSDGSKLELFSQNKFSLDDQAFMDALKLFTESKRILLSNVSPIGSTARKELERYLFAFVLYASKRLGGKVTGDDSEGASQSGVTLCQILKALKLNFVDFFKELPQFAVKLGPILSNFYGTDWEKRLEAKEMQTNFVHLSLLSNISEEFFKTSEATKERADTSSFYSDSISDYYRFGWLLFLAIRVHECSRFKNLVTSTNALVSVLAILIIHIPACLRNFRFLDSPIFEKKTEQGVNLVASLCQKYDTSEDEVKKMMDKANDLLKENLRKNPCSASQCKTENLDNIDTDDLTYFEDLLEDSSLPTSISILDKDYDAAIWNKGDIDERIFVNEDDSLLGSGSLSGGAMHININKRKLDAMASPTKTITSPLSPSRSPLHLNTVRGGVNTRTISMPVSTAMTTARWLRAFISPLPPKPSAQLEKFFVSCDRNVSSEIVRRAHIIMDAIFPNSALGERCVAGSLPNSNLADNIWAQQRRLEALKLYYRVLEAICIAETQLLHSDNLTSLLTNERFHRCMLACSAELVLATHKTVTLLFPAVLEKTGITAFDLSKVIESFIRHEESLPRELRRHLNSLEETLLESMVWEKGSSMYNSLAIARPTLSAEINHCGLLAEPMPSLDSIAAHVNMSSGGLPPIPSSHKHEVEPGKNGDVKSPKRACLEYHSALVERNAFTSPVKDRLINNLKQKLTPPALQSAFASPTRPSPGGGGETCAETGINIFFTKIVKLAAVRINAMIERLDKKTESEIQTQQFRESVYWLFQQILNEQTSLFFNRHIDQIILCSFYGVAKISLYQLTFKDIILNYRKEPHCKPQVFRSVYIDWSSTQSTERQGQDYVDIITFYNEVFMPSVKLLLVELDPQEVGVKTDLVLESNNGKEGHCPGSPKISTFPSLPDLSSKKIVNNVYVSPLRSSKGYIERGGFRELRVTDGSVAYRSVGLPHHGGGGVLSLDPEGRVGSLKFNLPPNVYVQPGQLGVQHQRMPAECPPPVYGSGEVLRPSLDVRDNESLMADLSIPGGDLGYRLLQGVTLPAECSYGVWTNPGLALCHDLACAANSAVEMTEAYWSLHNELDRCYEVVHPLLKQNETLTREGVELTKAKETAEAAQKAAETAKEAVEAAKTGAETAKKALEEELKKVKEENVKYQAKSLTDDGLIKAFSTRVGEYVQEIGRVRCELDDQDAIIRDLERDFDDVVAQNTRKDNALRLLDNRVLVAESWAQAAETRAKGAEERAESSNREAVPNFISSVELRQFCTDRFDGGWMAAMRCVLSTDPDFDWDAVETAFKDNVGLQPLNDLDTFPIEHAGNYSPRHTGIHIMPPLVPKPEADASQPPGQSQ